MVFKEMVAGKMMMKNLEIENVNLLLIKITKDLNMIEISGV